MQMMLVDAYRSMMGQGRTSTEALDDRYFVQKVKLGEGALATVFRGKEKATGKVVAIKQINKIALKGRNFCNDDIKREAYAMKLCEHPNILKCYDRFEDNQCIFVVLEYCDGGDFGDMIKEKAQSLREYEAAGWIKQICRAIQALHSKQVCHRDIKPENFILAGYTVAKLCDFGLAVVLDKGKLLKEKCGTPGFMAPEMHRLPEEGDGYGLGVDVWAAGVLMYSLLNQGRHPFMDSSGQLSMKSLFAGELDFSRGVFALLEQRRCSDESEALCRRMIDTSQNSRISVDEALENVWLLQDNAKFIQDEKPRFLACCTAGPTTRECRKACGRDFGSVVASGRKVDDPVTFDKNDYGVYSKLEPVLAVL